MGTLRILLDICLITDFLCAFYCAFDGLIQLIKTGGDNQHKKAWSFLLGSVALFICGFLLVLILHSTCKQS
ncbi:MAG: hypothetical protein LBL71_00540 [Endomicrobium sp.]|jgi:putative flippase GtrA|nr:hypothetical protein [Endomicrobium sp.]